MVQLSLFPGIDLEELSKCAQSLISSGAHAAATERVYAWGWRNFAGWCESAGLPALPACENTVCLFLASVSVRVKLSTVRMFAWSIADHHRAAGLAVPIGSQVRQLVAGIARTHGSRREPKDAISPDELRRMLAALDRTRARGARDAALLLLGFASGLRRSDLVALDVEDVGFSQPGLVVQVGRGKREKNDQGGEGRRIGLYCGRAEDTCPVRAMRAWLQFRGLDSGPLFIGLSPRFRGGRLGAGSVSRIVKRGVRSIGLPPARYGAHSLRSGMITAATRAGVPVKAIMARSGHKSSQMIDLYVRGDVALMNPLDGVL